MAKKIKKKELSCASVKSSGMKEVPDKLCLTRVEHKNIVNWLKRNEGKFMRKDLRKQYRETCE